MNVLKRNDVHSMAMFILYIWPWCFEPEVELQVQRSMETAPWRKNFKMAWGKQLLRKRNGSVSVTPRTFPWGFFTSYIILSISVRKQIKVNPGRVHGMPKMFSPSCVLAVLLILSSFGASWQGKRGKKGSYSVPLLRTKRDLRDSRGNPTENLKGRPGQGYYISTDLGTPAQRVSRKDLFVAMFIVIILRPQTSSLLYTIPFPFVMS